MKIIIIGLCLLFPAILLSSWPIFPIPNSEQVLCLIVQENCPVGYGKIKANSTIPITLTKVSNKNWYWRFDGDTACHKIPEIIKYQYFAQNGQDYFRQIRIGFGTSSEKLLYTFSLVVPWSDLAEAPWYCGPMENSQLPNYVSCAYDQ